MKKTLLTLCMISTLFAFTPPDLSYLEEYDTRMYVHLESLGVDDTPFSCNLGNLQESRHTSYLIISSNSESIYVNGLLSISPKVKTDKIQVKVMSGRCKGKYGWIMSKSMLYGGTDRLFEDYNDGLEETISKLSNNFEIEKLRELHSHLKDEPKKKVQNAIEQIEEKLDNTYKEASLTNTIQSYENFLGISKYSNTNEYREARKKLEKLYQALYQKTYESIKKENNIAGYEWFIKTYPNAPQVKEAIETIHTLAYNKAKSINTVSAYNTFIIAYPYAKQVQDANDKAYKLEEKEYTDIGMLGFFGKEEKMDRKGRELLNRAKMIERKANDKSYDAKAGYTLIANRMYTLLQDRFISSDATTRYLESQEFKDFVQTFKSVMRDIGYKLDNIADYSSQIIEVSKQGFQDANSDRELSRYKDEEHRKWEKRMHLREKGYM